ncbi:MAG: hypothetical protein QOI54_153 [Actinomycetota bacterium]|nr:hypothetical protein [Actinomycetota bacterium]
MSTPTGPRITTVGVVVLRPNKGRRLEFRDVEVAPWHHVPDGGRLELQLQGVSTWTTEVPPFVARAVENATSVVVRGNTKPDVLEQFRAALIRAAERIRRERARETRTQGASDG